MKIGLRIFGIFGKYAGDLRPRLRYKLFALVNIQDELSDSIKFVAAFRLRLHLHLHY